MTRVGKGMKMGELELDAVYRSPSNRLCRWLPGDRLDAVVHFVYVGANGQPDSRHNPDGFALTRGNLWLMKRVG